MAHGHPDQLQRGTHPAQASPGRGREAPLLRRAGARLIKPLGQLSENILQDPRDPEQFPHAGGVAWLTPTAAVAGPAPAGSPCGGCRMGNGWLSRTTSRISARSFQRQPRVGRHRPDRPPSAPPIFRILRSRRTSLSLCVLHRQRPGRSLVRFQHARRSRPFPRRRGPALRRPTTHGLSHDSLGHNPWAKPHRCLRGLPSHRPFLKSRRPRGPR